MFARRQRDQHDAAAHRSTCTLSEAGGADEERPEGRSSSSTNLSDLRSLYFFFVHYSNPSRASIDLPVIRFAQIQQLTTRAAGRTDRLAAATGQGGREG